MEPLIRRLTHALSLGCYRVIITFALRGAVFWRLFGYLQANECERTRASTFSIQRIQFCRVCKRCRCWYGCPARAWHAQICCSSRWRILMAAGLHIHSERHTIACKERLNISTRQVQRLVASFNRPHACSIISTSAKRRSHSTHASAHVRTHARTHTGT